MRTAAQMFDEAEKMGWKLFTRNGRNDLQSTRFLDGCGLPVQLQVNAACIGYLHFMAPRGPVGHLRGKAASDAYHNRGNGVTADPSRLPMATRPGDDQHDLLALLRRVDNYCEEHVK